MDDTCVIIPVYNESQSIKNVISSLHFFKNIICIDDGSIDDCDKIIQDTPAKLIQHTINLGQGAAIQTGIEFALQDPNLCYFVTFDADGQHQVVDIINMIKAIRKRDLDVIIGSRFLGSTVGMPYYKKALLKIGILFTNSMNGSNLTDVHNGLRVFNRKVAESINIENSDYSHASEITEKIFKNNYKYVEMPVTITYTKYSKTKGQPMSNAVNIAFDELLKKFNR